MGFEIKFAAEESFESLNKKIENGIPVRRTAHLGNFYPSQLLIAYYKVPFTLFDRNINDKNYHPHLIISGGEKTEIAQADKLSMLQKDTLVHLDQLEKVFPDTYFETETRFWQKVRDKFELKDILASVIDKTLNLGLWRRYVHDDGYIEEIDKSKINAKSIIGDVLNIDSDSKGWVIPNELNILLPPVLNAKLHDSQMDQEFHLAGPDMPNYINKHKVVLRDLYELLIKRFARSEEFFVGDYFYLHILPTAHIRYITTLSNTENMASLLRNVMCIEEIKKEKADAIKKARDDEARRGVIEKFALKMNTVKHDIKDAINHLRHDLYYDIRDASYLTQHDVQSKSELYVPEEVYTMSFERIYKIGREIDAIAENIGGIFPGKHDVRQQQKRMRMMLSGTKIK